MKTKGEDYLFGSDMDLPNLESDESEMRDIGETNVDAGNTKKSAFIPRARG